MPIDRHEHASPTADTGSNRVRDLVGRLRRIQWRPLKVYPVSGNIYLNGVPAGGRRKMECYASTTRSSCRCVRMPSPERMAPSN